MASDRVVAMPHGGIKARTFPKSPIYNIRRFTDSVNAPILVSADLAIVNFARMSS